MLLEAPRRADPMLSPPHNACTPSPCTRLASLRAGSSEGEPACPGATGAAPPAESNVSLSPATLRQYRKRPFKQAKRVLQLLRPLVEKLAEPAAAERRPSGQEPEGSTARCDRFRRPRRRACSANGFCLRSQAAQQGLHESRKPSRRLPIIALEQARIRPHWTLPAAA
jgi:hypothetical protein